MDVASIITELDEHGFSDTSSTRKVALLNDTYWDLCSREPWPFLEASLTLAFNGTLAYPSNWPTDFSKALSLTNPTNGDVVQVERWEVLQKKYADTLANTATGAVPLYYYFKTNRINVYPVPSATTTLTLNYVKWPTALTAADVEATILIPARHHRALILGALYKLYAMEDDPELSSVFETEYDKRIAMMREDLIRMQYDLADHIFVTNEDDFDSYNYYGL